MHLMASVALEACVVVCSVLKYGSNAKPSTNCKENEGSQLVRLKYTQSKVDGNLARHITVLLLTLISYPLLKYRFSTRVWSYPRLSRTALQSTYQSALASEQSDLIIESPLTVTLDSGE